MLACRASIHKPDTNPARFSFSSISVQPDSCSARYPFSLIPVQLNPCSAQSPFSLLPDRFVLQGFSCTPCTARPVLSPAQPSPQPCPCHVPLLLPGNPESFLFLPLPYPPRWAIKIPRKHVRSRGIPTFPILLYFLCAVSCAQSLPVIADAAADTVSPAVLLLPASSPRLPPAPGSSPALPARTPIRGIRCSP